MAKSGKLFLLVVLMLSCLFSSAHAQLPQIQTGLSYLTSSQNLDGTWDNGTSLSETTAATVSVIETLKLLNQTASAPYSAGVSWLQAQSPNSIAYIAERSSALGLASSVSGLLSALDPRTGACGGVDGYETNILDTSLVLQALKSSGYSDFSVLSKILAYLTTTQNTDGGWGFQQGYDSNVYMTAVVSATLQQFPQMSTIATAINNATTYLRAHQNTDGGFGSSTSTVYETALAYSALVAVSNDAAMLGGAVNYLSATQSANGSWYDDPYSTALALKALYYSENKPAPPPPPPAGGKIAGTVVDAVTKAPVSGVSVVLGSNSLINTTSDSSGNFTLNDIPAGNQNVQFSLSGYASKTASASVVIDSVANLGNVEMLSSYFTGTIAGIITDTAGKPVSDATVAVSGAWSGTALTGADGTYAFSYVLPGEVTLTAAKAGYQPITGTGTVFPRTKLTFSPRLSTMPPQGSTGTLVGRVVDSYWGVPIGHLPGEEGVTVRVSGGITVEPDDAGYFTIPGLAPNTYQVTVGMNGFASQTFRVVITAGSTDLGTIRLSGTVTEMTLTGKITDATTGAPIPGAQVLIQGSDLAGRADFTGSYGIADIKVGSELAVKVSADGYIGKSFTVSPSPWRRTMDFSLMPHVTDGTLTGTVIDASTNAPLAGVRLTLVEDPSVGATTNADGVFSLNNVKQGAQKVSFALAGYSSRILTTTITPGSVNSVGRIALSVSPLAASVQGTVWDAVTNQPFAGVSMHATGTGVNQATTGADGTYRMDAVEPGEVTVATGAVPKAGFSSARFTGILEPGGVLVFNPVLSMTIPVTLDVSVQTDKNIYKTGETVGVSFHLQNRQAAPITAKLHVQVVDPAGIRVFEKTFGVDLAADGTSDLQSSYYLPLSGQSGTYNIVAETFGVSGSLLHRAVKTFGVTISQVEVKPTLPAVFSAGANNVTFDIVNSGTITVSQGRLDVTLTDPDGQVVSTALLPFVLDPGHSTNLSLTVAIPALKFGSYTLSFAQSDETKMGEANAIVLPNTIAVTALYDDASHRVRNTANLSVTVSNTGRFNFDPAGAAVNISVPDAAFSATKTLPSLPAPGTASTAGLLFSFTIPDILAAGQHGTRIAVTLPSGSDFTQSAALTIAESSLGLSPIQGAYIAGGAIHPLFSNQGGVDTQAEYSFRLVDAKSTLVAERIATESVAAGATLPVEIAIPAGAVDGTYQLIGSYKDVKTGKTGMMQYPLAISGVKGSLQVKTDKENYLLTENVTGLSTISNGGTALQGGNLHLQVVTGPGSEKKKTWTTQMDFQTGVRSGVDTYGVNDWIVPDDDFDNLTLDTNKWQPYGTVSVESGKLMLNTTQAAGSSGVASKWSLEDDFDIQIDFANNFSSAWTGAQISVVFGSGSFLNIGNYQSPGYNSDLVVNSQIAMHRTAGTPSTSGRFRISRQANAVFTYYWSGTSWVEMVRYDSTYDSIKLSGPCKVGIAIYRDPAYPGATASFDNFKVITGRIKTENQTVDAVRLLPLNDNFDDGVVNEDRWGIYGPKPEESSGVIHLIADATIPSNYLGLRKQLSGDFAAVSVYKKYSSTPSQVSSGRYIMGGAVGGSSFYINRSSDLTRGGGNFLVSLSNLGDSWYMTSDLPYSSDSGRFRLKRAGSIASTEYWNGSTWVTQHSRYSFPTAAATIWHHCLSQDTVPVIKVDLDSFYTNKGIYTNEGTLTLRFDSEVSANQWEKLLYSADIPVGSTIKLRTRTAETMAELGSALWSPYMTSSGAQITSPAGRYIEVEAQLNTTDSNITPVLHDLSVTYAAQPDEILWQTDVPANLAASAGSELQQLIGTLGVIGKLYIQGALISNTGQAVASAESPFYVEQGNIQLLMAPDRKIYRPGETVTMAGEVRNASSVSATGFVLQVADKAGSVLFTDTFDVPANSTRPFSFTTTAAGDGMYQVVGTVIQNSTRVAYATEVYEVASPGLTASVIAPETVGEEPFVISVSLANTGRVSAASSVRIVNDTGDIVGEQAATLAAGESRILQFTDRIYGDTTYRTIVSGDLSQTLINTVNFAVTSTISSVSGKIVADKVSYNPNEQVTLTSTVSATSPRENLAAVIAITNSQGQVVYSATADIPLLMQGQTLSIKNYWNSGSYPAGTYLTTLKVMDSAGVAVSTSTCTLLINATDKPTALLKGKVLLDTQSILTGEPVTATYSVTNAGNADVANLSVTVRIVSADGEVLNSFVSEVGPLAIGASHTGTQRVETLNYGARDYLVLLTATINGVEESLTSTFFRVEGAPSTPALFSPAVGSDIETLTPALIVSNAADPNDNRLSYQFEIYADSSLATLVVSGTVPETSGATAWTVPVQLVENATYTWRARAFDGLLYGPWMSPASFRVNLANDAPSAPSIASPMNGSAVAVLAPQLTVSNANDPDSTSLTYNFDIALDPDFAEIVASVRGVSPSAATTSWTVPVNLQENGTYYWRAQADDWLIEGPWSATARFFVNTANEAPSVPVVTAPVTGSTVTSLAIEVVVANSSDPDSASISYFFEADTVPNFDSGHVIRSAGVPEGGGSTSWDLTGLSDNTRYYLHAKASDGSAESEWSAVTSFFANTANDAPTIPVLANPSSGAGVNVFAPLLSVHNASDLDQDALSYEFELYADPALTNLLARAEGIAETPSVTGWQVPLSLTENLTYYWRSRAFDGSLHGDWTPGASFTVNTANDAPGAPKLLFPADGAAVEVANPVLTVANAEDPDSDSLTYHFELYAGGTLVTASAAVAGNPSGIISWSPETQLADNTVYEWRARAHDGDSYGSWMTMGTFTVHIPKTSITATVDFDPDTLNRTSKGTWVVVYIELPQGYSVADIDISSIRLEGGIPAEVKPFAIGDHDRDGIADLMVKFRRGDLIDMLDAGDKVTVHVTGTVGPITFDGVDVIRVIK